MPFVQVVIDEIIAAFPLNPAAATVMTPTQFGAAYLSALTSVIDHAWPRRLGRSPGYFPDLADCSEYLADRIIAYMDRRDVTDALRRDYSTQLVHHNISVFEDCLPRGLFAAVNDSERRDAFRVVERLNSAAIMHVSAIQDTGIYTSTVRQAVAWRNRTEQTLIGSGSGLRASPALDTGENAPLGLSGAAVAPVTIPRDTWRPSVTASVQDIQTMLIHRAVQGTATRPTERDFRVITWNTDSLATDERWSQVSQLTIGGTPGWGAGADVLLLQEVMGPPANATYTSTFYPLDQYGSRPPPSPQDPAPSPGWQVDLYRWQPHGDTDHWGLLYLTTGRRSRDLAIAYRQPLADRIMVDEIIVLATPYEVSPNGNRATDVRPIFGARLYWRNHPDTPVTFYCIHAETGANRPVGYSPFPAIATIGIRTAGLWIAAGDFNSVPTGERATRSSGSSLCWPTPPGMHTHWSPQTPSRLDYMFSDPSGLTGQPGDYPMRLDGTSVDSSTHKGKSDHYAVAFVVSQNPPDPPS